MHDSRESSWSERLPELGARGEGWVAMQLALYALIAGAGLLGPRWTGRARVPLKGAAALLATTGTGLMAAGVVTLGGSLTPYPRPRGGSILERQGVYSSVRHPIYGGVLVSALAWSLWLSPAALAPTVLTGAFLDLKARREEVLLEKRYADYPAYRRRVRRRFVPFLW